MRKRLTIDVTDSGPDASRGDDNAASATATATAAAPTRKRAGKKGHADGAIPQYMRPTESVMRSKMHHRTPQTPAAGRSRDAPSASAASAALSGVVRTVFRPELFERDEEDAGAGATAAAGRREGSKDGSATASRARKAVVPPVGVELRTDAGDDAVRLAETDILPSSSATPAERLAIQRASGLLDRGSRPQKCPVRKEQILAARGALETARSAMAASAIRPADSAHTTLHRVVPLTIAHSQFLREDDNVEARAALDVARRVMGGSRAAASALASVDLGGNAPAAGSGHPAGAGNVTHRHTAALLRGVAADATIDTEYWFRDVGRRTRLPAWVVRRADFHEALEREAQNGDMHVLDALTVPTLNRTPKQVEQLAKWLRKRSPHFSSLSMDEAAPIAQSLTLVHLKPGEHVARDDRVVYFVLSGTVIFADGVAVRKLSSGDALGSMAWLRVLERGLVERSRRGGRRMSEILAEATVEAERRRERKTIDAERRIQATRLAEVRRLQRQQKLAEATKEAEKEKEKGAQAEADQKAPAAERAEPEAATEPASQPAAEGTAAAVVPFASSGKTAGASAPTTDAGPGERPTLPKGLTAFVRTAGGQRSAVPAAADTASAAAPDTKAAAAQSPRSVVSTGAAAPAAAVPKLRLKGLLRRAAAAAADEDEAGEEAEGSASGMSSAKALPTKLQTHARSMKRAVRARARRFSILGGDGVVAMAAMDDHKSGGGAGETEGVGSLMRGGVHRTAGVRLVRLSMDDYARALQAASSRLRRRIAVWLQTSMRVFSTWKLPRLLSLGQWMDRRSVPKGMDLFSQGEAVGAVFILVSGEVELVQRVKLQVPYRHPTGRREWSTQVVSKTVEVTVRHVAPGEFFGEESVLLLLPPRARIREMRRRGDLPAIADDETEGEDLMDPGFRSDTPTTAGAAGRETEATRFRRPSVTFLDVVSDRYSLTATGRERSIKGHSTLARIQATALPTRSSRAASRMPEAPSQAEGSGPNERSGRFRRAILRATSETDDGNSASSTATATAAAAAAAAAAAGGGGKDEEGKDEGEDEETGDGSASPSQRPRRARPQLTVDVGSGSSRPAGSRGQAARRRRKSDARVTVEEVPESAPGPAPAPQADESAEAAIPVRHFSAFATEDAEVLMLRAEHLRFLEWRGGGGGGGGGGGSGGGVSARGGVSTSHFGQTPGDRPSARLASATAAGATCTSRGDVSGYDGGPAVRALVELMRQQPALGQLVHEQLASFQEASERRKNTFEGVGPKAARRMGLSGTLRPVAITAQDIISGAGGEGSAHPRDGLRHEKLRVRRAGAGGKHGPEGDAWRSPRLNQLDEVLATDDVGKLQRSRLLQRHVRAADRTERRRVRALQQWASGWGHGKGVDGAGPGGGAVSARGSKPALPPLPLHLLGLGGMEPGGGALTAPERVSSVMAAASTATGTLGGGGGGGPRGLGGEYDDDDDDDDTTASEGEEGGEEHGVGGGSFGVGLQRSKSSMRRAPVYDLSRVQLPFVAPAPGENEGAAIAAVSAVAGRSRGMGGTASALPGGASAISGPMSMSMDLGNRGDDSASASVRTGADGTGSLSLAAGGSGYVTSGLRTRRDGVGTADERRIGVIEHGVCKSKAQCGLSSKTASRAGSSGLGPLSRFVRVAKRREEDPVRMGHDAFVDMFDAVADRLACEEAEATRRARLVRREARARRKLERAMGSVAASVGDDAASALSAASDEEPALTLEVMQAVADAEDGGLLGALGSDGDDAWESSEQFGAPGARSGSSVLAAALAASASRPRPPLDPSGPWSHSGERRPSVSGAVVGVGRRRASLASAGLGIDVRPPSDGDEVAPDAVGILASPSFEDDAQERARIQQWFDADAVGAPDSEAAQGQQRVLQAPPSLAGDAPSEPRPVGPASVTSRSGELRMAVGDRGDGHDSENDGTPGAESGPPRATESRTLRFAPAGESGLPPGVIQTREHEALLHGLEQSQSRQKWGHPSSWGKLQERRETQARAHAAHERRRFHQRKRMARQRFRHFRRASQAGKGVLNMLRQERRGSEAPQGAPASGTGEARTAEATHTSGPGDEGRWSPHSGNDDHVSNDGSIQSTSLMLLHSGVNALRGFSRGRPGITSRRSIVDDNEVDEPSMRRRKHLLRQYGDRSAVARAVFKGVVRGVGQTVRLAQQIGIDVEFGDGNQHQWERVGGEDGWSIASQDSVGRRSVGAVHGRDSPARFSADSDEARSDLVDGDAREEGDAADDGDGLRRTTVGRGVDIFPM